MLEFFKPNRAVVLAFTLFVSFASCNNRSEQFHIPESEIIEDALKYRYLALGDSYTIGTALPDSSRSYPYQLVERLNQEHGLQGGKPEIVAFGGWRSDQLASAISEASLTEEYDLVSLLIGVNNQFQNQPDSIYFREFEELLSSAIDLAGKDTTRVFVLSIPDYGLTPFGKKYPNASAGVDAFNAINSRITKDFGISYFDITDISRKAEVDSNLLAPDGLHPSEAMYKLWVDKIVNDVKAKLNE